ncbi:MAG: glycosyltransferase family 9 protein [Candidatus Eisenbacteria bacterium]|nr:glycosyltransferase family 9 protein [Candidatus Eisenbacteria bacterium]
MKVESTCKLALRLATAPPRSILVLRPGAMGDVLLTTPALRALRRGFPDATLSVLVTRAGEAILRGNPNVDEIIVLDKSSLRSQAGVIPLVRRKRFDLIVDFLCNPRTAIIALLSGAPQRLGYDVRMRKIAYNHRKARDEYREGKKVVKYAAQVNLDMLRCVGIESVDTGLDLEVSEAARSKMDEFLRLHSIEKNKLVCVCPAGTWPAKTWEVEKFAGLGDRIVSELGREVVILWGPGEKALAEKMARAMKAEAVIACETGVDEVSAIIRNSALFVSNDSGLKHIAVGLGTPTVTIFGPTNPRTWNPDEPAHGVVYAAVDCLFCDKNVCDDMRCMKELSVGAVFSTVKEVLDRGLRGIQVGNFTDSGREPGKCSATESGRGEPL